MGWLYHAHHCSNMTWSSIPYHSFIGYMNAPIEPAFIYLRNYMEYLIYRSRERIVYSIKNIFNLNEDPHQCFFKSGIEDIKKY